MPRPKRNAVLEAALNPVIPERIVQKQIIDLLRQLQIPFWRIGQRNAKGTQDAGVADIVCFPPVSHASVAGLLAGRVTLWIEVKRSKGGRWSEAQQMFCAEARSAVGSYYLVINDVAELAAKLVVIKGRGRP